MTVDRQTTQESTQAAGDVVEANKYLVLATATPGGTPWVTPVYFAHDDFASFWWVSRPLARHSRLISMNPQVAITVFDSSVPVGRAAAVYAEAWAAQCSDSDARREIGSYSERSQQHGNRPWTVDDVSGDAEFRLYRARTARLWLLADDGGPDHRIPIALDTLAGAARATPSTNPGTDDSINR
ncbi:pyridoxamine 5'-phosphate oxidase family protein [Nakamurella lactea]|uniref:pyridoxamine 5'-phosphate oxidase family protein n=1 Tax=Nakamurella lactea TaxID=459515 RepID=UPI00040DEC33|nr:pyridoxamine 5'-phosphate oxidase family protein [Nakamurella lactea]